MHAAEDKPSRMPGEHTRPVSLKLYWRIIQMKFLGVGTLLSITIMCLKWIAASNRCSDSLHGHKITTVTLV